MKHTALPIIIDRPGPDCSRPPADRLCVCISGCGHAMTPRLRAGGYHFTRCALDGGAEAFERVPEPPKSGRRRVVKLAAVIPMRRIPFRMKLCRDPFAELPPAPVEPRLARWKAIVGRPRIARRRILASAPERTRRRALRPAWRKGWVCPRTECRYHLADLGNAQTAPGCALVIAARGAQSFTAIGKLCGCSLQNIQHILNAAVQRKGLERLREFAAEDTGRDRGVLTTGERVLRLLSAGSATTTELADGTGMETDRVRDALRRLEAEGRVCSTRLGASDQTGIEWNIVEHESDADNPHEGGIVAVVAAGRSADSSTSTAAEVTCA